jgi:ribonuclease P protein component
LRTSHLDLAWRPNPMGHPRLGIIVPRFQFTAVARNRLRRRVKEILRRDALPALPAVDLVVRATRAAYAASFAVLRADVMDLVSRVT